ncbi:hypothetical protein D210916BOD24_11030 [Alteromonas sp. D210916BOD_24]|uniref:hypothetical protein n=1 Tax=Alteromonas sp. D210916BOD_24 TaxID=3157618 RepID=UPI00399D1F56
MALPNYHLLFISNGSQEIDEVWKQLEDRFSCSFFQLNSNFSAVYQKKQLLALLLIAKKGLFLLKGLQKIKIIHVLLLMFAQQHFK